MKSNKKLYAVAVIGFLSAPLLALAQSGEVSQSIADIFTKNRSGEVLISSEADQLSAFLSENPRYGRGPRLAVPESTVSGENIVSCSEYYQMGSVVADIAPSVETTVSGGEYSFNGLITNTNPYPIVDGVLYVKILRKQDDATLAQQNGHHVVDQFVALEGISLNARSSQEVAFSWEVPAHALSGDYEMISYIVSAESFNYLGISFTDDIVGGVTEFTLIGEALESVVFDKNSVTVDGMPHSFAFYPTTVDKAKPIEVMALLTNQTDQEQVVPVIWKVYAWDAQRERNELDEAGETVRIPAHTTIRVTHTVTDNRNPSYLVVADARFRDVHSILNINFVREGMNKPRINAAGITSYPLIKGQENEFFSCLYNIGSADEIDGTRLTVSIKDSEENEIYFKEYVGSVSNAMMGISYPFTPPETLSSFTVETILYNQSLPVDYALLTYDCNDINAAMCDISVAEASSGSSAQPLLVILGLLGLVVVVVVIKKSAVKSKENPEPAVQEGDNGTTE